MPSALADVWSSAADVSPAKRGAALGAAPPWEVGGAAVGRSAAGSRIATGGFRSGSATPRRTPIAVINLTGQSPAPSVGSAGLGGGDSAQMPSLPAEANEAYEAAQETAEEYYSVEQAEVEGAEASTAYYEDEVQDEQQYLEQVLPHRAEPTLVEPHMF